MARVELKMNIVTSKLDFKAVILVLSTCILSSSNGGINAMIVKTAAKPYVCNGQASCHFANALGQSGSGSGQEISGSNVGFVVATGSPLDRSGSPSGDPSGGSDDGPAGRGRGCRLCLLRGLSLPRSSK